MNSNKIANPFVIGKYVSEDYFCDRTDETAFLKKQVDNGRNTAIIAPRRLGKTGLIQHFFAQPDIAKRYQTIFIDIYATNSLSEFVYLLGNPYTRNGLKGFSGPLSRCGLGSSWMLRQVNLFLTSV